MTGGKSIPYLLAILILVAGLAVYLQYFTVSAPLSTTVASLTKSEPVSGLQKGVTAEPLPLREPIAGQVSTAGMNRDAVKAAPEVPVPPQEVFRVPNNRYFVSINRQNSMAYLWQGDQPASILKAEFQWPDAPPAGLYVLGENINKQKFFFQLSKVLHARSSCAGGGSLAGCV